jgi:P27 family predicted phage terminase small subunit
VAQTAANLKQCPIKETGTSYEREFMLMGRPPKSSEEHRWQQTKQRPSVAKTHSDTVAGKPKMPGHLSPEAKKAWRNLVALLEERGTLSRADSMVLSIWSETQARWVLAKADVMRFGIVIETSVLDSNGTAVTSRKPNPALRTVENCEKSLRALAREFGCTPAARDRVRPAKPAEEKVVNIFDIVKESESEK